MSDKQYSRQEINKGNSISFVVAAMTEVQAIDLFRGTLLRSRNVSKDKFDQFYKFQREWARLDVRLNSGQQKIPFGSGLIGKFNTLLRPSAVTNKSLLPCYTNQRDKWRPLYCNCSVQEMIKETFEYYNEKFESLNGSGLELKFVSDSFFSENLSEHNKTADELREKGGVLIIDAISLFHPLLSERISTSAIVDHNKVAILLVFPVDATVLPVNKRIMELFDATFHPISSRYREKYDHLCEIDLGNVDTFKRWVIHTIPNVANAYLSMSHNRPNEKKAKALKALNMEQSHNLDSRQRLNAFGTAPIPINININSDSGTFIGNGVDTGGGSFTGRDSSETQ